MALLQSKNLRSYGLHSQSVSRELIINYIDVIGVGGKSNRKLPNPHPKRKISGWGFFIFVVLGVNWVCEHTQRFELPLFFSFLCLPCAAVDGSLCLFRLV
jgi:hypothetical protein